MPASHYGKLFYDNGMPAWKAKGAWAKPWVKENENKQMVQDYTDYDLVILREALTNYFVQGIPVEDTINGCKELSKFQKIVMVSSKYTGALHGVSMVKGSSKPEDYIGEQVNEKHLR